MATRGRRSNGDWSYTQRKTKVDELWTARKQFGYKENGKPNIKAFYGKTITEVRNKAKEYEKSLNAHKPETVNKTTVYDYVNNYIKTYKIMSVKRTTYDGMEDALEVRIKPFDISSIQMHNLNAEICQNYINELTACSKKYSLATITKTYNLLNNCFRYAVRVGDIPFNPIEFVKLPSPDIVQTPQKEIMFFNFEQVQKIIEQCNKKFKNGAPIYYYGNMIVFMMFTGIRIGECVGLTWEDVDLEKNEIYINNTVATVKTRNEGTSNKRVMTDTTPKTKKSVRRIPLSQNAKEALLSIKVNKTVKPADYISQTKTGKPASARNVQRSMEKVLKQLKIPDYKKYSLHSLRHPYVKYTTKIFFKKSKISFNPQTESRKGIRSQSCCRGIHKPV